MIPRVELIPDQKTFDPYRAQSTLSGLIPLREEITLTRLKRMIRSTNGLAGLIQGALCVDTEMDTLYSEVSELFIFRKFEANEKDCRRCPVIVKGAIGCVIYDKRVNPPVKTAIRKGRRDLRH